MADNGFLESSVGNNFENKEEDVIRVKSELSKRGYYTRPVENGIIDAESTKAIKEFPKDRGLKVDGHMNLGHKAFEIGCFSPVVEHEETINRKSQELGVDPDLVKSIMHIENVRGYYDELKKEPDSLRPMNVRTGLWSGLGYSRDD